MINYIVSFVFFSLISSLAFAQQQLTISSCQELQEIKNDLSGDYQLVSDIDCAGFPWQPINGTFTGKLSGKNADQNFTIKNIFIHITQPENLNAYVNHSGLFETIKEATISDITISNNTLKITGKESFGYGGYGCSRAGLLTSNIINSKIKNIVFENNSLSVQPYCLNVGLLTGELSVKTLSDLRFDNNQITIQSYFRSVGFLAGLGSSIGAISNITIENSRISLNGPSDNSTGLAGGLFGQFSWGNILNNRLANVSITGIPAAKGGLIGQAANAGNIIKNNHLEKMTFGDNAAGIINFMKISSWNESITIEENTVSDAVFLKDGAGLINYINVYYSLHPNKVVIIKNNAISSHMEYGSGLINSIPLNNIYYEPGIVISNNYALTSFTSQLSNQYGFIGNIGSNTILLAQDNFWDNSLAPHVPSDSIPGINGISTQQMQNPTTFIEAGWDMVNIWQAPMGQYPFLRK